ncbi:uncharacterized protein MCYG_07377 [Microsporum canis CBS 113480]|uniref:Uncharacterized protein n=1 Tax=Arthroderma otae (strain ATCC MYA-4605 / CBS 113480) TaxID=554155 RepID=C5FYG0_ARTOC|nr:uncharacterized protein MCYG_07377 [Microsporum canis CBS 113480]EEQ34558.1 predicted protein [Microsporum canis CBS 113480]
MQEDSTFESSLYASTIKSSTNSPLPCHGPSDQMKRQFLKTAEKCPIRLLLYWLRETVWDTAAYAYISPPLEGICSVERHVLSLPPLPDLHQKRESGWLYCAFTIQLLVGMWYSVNGWLSKHLKGDL